MLLKKLILFGLCLFSVCPVCAYEIKEFCHYDIGDFRGSSKYDAQSDEIVIENCIWGTGFNCSSYKISKLAEFDGVKIYYSSEHPDNVFINDNGVWKWEDAGCNFEEQIPEVLKEEAEQWKKFGLKLEYAGKDKLPSGEYVYFYVTVAPEDTLTGFPTVYEIINNEIYLKLSGFDALDTLAIVQNKNTISEKYSIPKMLEGEAEQWRALDFQIVYIGKYPDNPKCDVYKTKDISGINRETGFPTVYLVCDDGYVERTGFDALELINKVSENK